VLCVERIRPRGPSADGRHTCRMNSASRGLRPMVGLRRPGRGFASAEADAWRAAPGRADFNRRKSLRPMVGLRRPGRGFASAEADAWRAAPGRTDFQSAQKPSAGGRPAPTGGFLLRRRRPTPGAQRLEGPISIGAKAFGRWSACTPNEFGLQGPSAGGRPAPTGKGFCVGGGRRLARSALRGRFQSAQKPSAGGRPAPTGRFLLRRRRPTPGAQRLEGPISIGAGG
jgi:hypothetical protein